MNFRPEQQYILEKPGILLSFEQLRINFKHILRHLEHESHVINSTLTTLISQENASMDEKIEKIDSLLSRVSTVKKKVSLIDSFFELDICNLHGSLCR